MPTPGGAGATWQGSPASAAEGTCSYLLTCDDVGWAATVGRRADLSRDHVAEVLLVPPPAP